MKKFLLLIASVFAFTRLLAQTNEPVRLALISENDPAATAADILTAQFSGNQKIQLLERDQIARVYREQGLSAADTDYLKLGQILGADGLLLLQTVTEGTNQFLNVRFVAVKPGVVLLAEKFIWPIANLTEWASPFAGHLGVFLPKLTVLIKDAIPISVVNLRSAVNSSEAGETEQQLKVLTIQRLSREPQLFVLERQKMQLLTEEKELKMDDPAFWNGSYLLEGVLDQNGYSKETITINARLTPPKGGAPLEFEVNGSRTNLVEVVNQLAAKVNEALKLNTTMKEWNAADEAAQYFEEAKWALRWGVLPEAQAAADSAWALGQRTTAVMSLRLQSYLGQAPSFTKQWPGRYILPLPTPDPANLELAIHVLELYYRDAPLVMAQGGLSSTKNPPSDPYLAATAKGVLKVNGRIQVRGTITFSSNVEWFDIGLTALNLSSAVLQNFNEVAEARSGHEPQLAELRSSSRELAAFLETNVPPDRDIGGSAGTGCTLYALKWEDGGRWFDKPEEALPVYEEMLKSGYRPSERYTPDEREHRDLPQIVGWSWEDRRRIPDLLKQFAASLAASTNQDLQLEGLLYKLILTPYDSSGRLVAVQNELYGQIWEQRQRLHAGQIEAPIMDRIYAILRHKYGIPYGVETPWTPEPFTVFQQHLQNPDGLSGIKGDNQRLPARPTMNTPVKTFPSPATNTKSITVTFTDWKLDLPQMNPRLRPIVQSAIIRQGRLWAEVQCDNPSVDRDERRAFFVGVDLQTGLGEVIQFPSELGSPSQFFEVTTNSLYAVQGNRLERYPFQTKRWETINVPMGGDFQVLELKGRLYLATSDIILELAPDTQTIQILASSRRRPAINHMDELGGFGKVFAGQDGKLVVLAQRGNFTYSPDNRVWEEYPGAASDAMMWYSKIPIRYEKDGQPFDSIDQHAMQFQGLGGPINWTLGRAFKLDTTQGRVVISPGLMGHWLVPETALASSLEELRHFVLTNTPAFQKP